MNLISIVTSSINTLRYYQDPLKASKSTEVPLTPHKLICGEMLKQQAAPGESSSPWPAHPFLHRFPPPVATRWGSEAPLPAKPRALRPPAPAPATGAVTPPRLPEPANRQTGCWELSLKKVKEQIASVLLQTLEAETPAVSSCVAIERGEIGANLFGRVSWWSWFLTGVWHQSSLHQSPTLHLENCRFVTASWDSPYDSCIFISK